MRSAPLRRTLGLLATGALALSLTGTPQLAAPSSAAPAAAPSLGTCPMLPADNVWNARIDSLPVHASSNAWINSIGTSTGLKADFGSGTWNDGPIGIPFVVVPGTQPLVPITFQYASESDPGPYPIPPDAPIEGGSNSTGDRHILVVDGDNCVLYETWSTYPTSTGWRAGSGARFDLKSNALRPSGWTSSDAAGLPVLPGLVRYDEVAAGAVQHAIRFTANTTQRAYLWPARHYASSNTDPNVPPMGARVRLKAGYNISGFDLQIQVLLQAFKTYGLILADNGSNWYLSGVPDERWNNTVLATLRNVPGSAFEVVDESGLMVDPNSGQVKGGAGSTATPTPTGLPATATPTATRPPATATPTATSVPTATPGTGASVAVSGRSMGDTWITPDEPTVSHASWDQAHLQGSGTPDRLLFQPSLSALPAGATVDRATLQVYAYSANSSGDTLAAYQILSPWRATSATYNSPWSAPGLQPGVDYASTPVGSATVGGVGWLTVDVTGAVRNWRAGTPNRGLMLRLAGGAAGAHYRVYLAETSPASLRPKLTIAYH